MKNENTVRVLFISSLMLFIASVVVIHDPGFYSNVDKKKMEMNKV